MADRALDVIERALTGSFDRVLIVAAHPDDETIGAAAAMSRMRNVRVLHLAGGAGVHDLELVRQLVAATEDLARAIDRIKPAVVITHAYEGGHPVHDAAAFIVQHALPATVAAGEMAFYHAGRGTLRAGQFLSAIGPQLTFELSAAERESKRRMFERLTTEREVLELFPIECERFRDAPGYDFRNPPHPGPLWYEILKSPMTGNTWRQLAAEAARQLAARGRRRE